MEKLSYEYITGLFDGEGCISSTLTYTKGKYEKYPRIAVQLSITNQHKGVLLEVMNICGGSVSLKESNTGCYVWKLTGKNNMKVFLESIKPFSIIKRDQIELALLFIETLRTENLGCCPLSQNIHEIRYYIHKRLIDAKKIVPADGDISEQIAEIAGKSLWDNPQPSLYEEGSETIMAASLRDDGIVRPIQQCIETGRNDQSLSNESNKSDTAIR